MSYQLSGKTGSNQTFWLSVSGSFLIIGFFLIWMIIKAKAGWVINTCLLYVVLGLFFIWPEMFLRLSGFRYESGVEFGYPRPHEFVNFEPDEKLFWRLKPDQPGVNSLGFPGAEFDFEKESNVFRIVFLGDSVTQQGYPYICQSILNTQGNGEKYEAVSLAVSGYSSHQGRVLAQNYAHRLDPDVAVVFFGWNDHWLAYGDTDANKKVEVTEESVGRQLLKKIYHELRLLQLGVWVVSKVSQTESVKSLGVQRVPVEQYKANLSSIITVFSSHDVPVVLLTAPSTHAKLGVPEYLVREGFVISASDAIDLHATYNDVVRQLGDIDGVTVIDLDSLINQADNTQLKQWFMQDGIHLTEAGLEYVAGLLTPVLKDIRP